MEFHVRGRAHPIWQCIEQKNGYVKVKISKNKWQGLGAYLLQKSGVKIVEGDRVFFADGDRTNRSVENLRRIHFNTTKFVLLKRSRPIYIPDVGPAAPSRKVGKEQYYKVAV